MKVTITIEDTTPGKCTLEMSFDPPQKENGEGTAASDYALGILKYCADRAAEEAKSLRDGAALSVNESKPE